jgi:hypothetical protein
MAGVGDCPWNLGPPLFVCKVTSRKVAHKGQPRNQVKTVIEMQGCSMNFVAGFIPFDSVAVLTT